MTIEFLREILSDQNFDNQFSFNADELFQIQYNMAFNSVGQNLSQYIKDIISIRRDVMENLENIISSMEMIPFSVILNKYGEKL